MMNGLLVVDKPAGLTSFDVVARLRRLTKTRRVGHAGTLDPLATGVLVVALGPATRLLEYLSGADKQYETTILLGVTTDTADAAGRVLRRVDVAQLSPEEIRRALEQFVGEILQVPPAVSAVKVGGERAYRLARAGQDVALPPRRVVVHAITPLAITPPTVRLRVHCGSGVYIRSLARDLGERLGVGGHVLELRRLAVGEFSLAQAHSLDELEEATRRGTLSQLVLPPERALAGWLLIPVTAREAACLRQGKPLAAVPTQPRAAAIDERGRLVAILEAANGYWQPTKVWPQEEGP